VVVIDDEDSIREGCRQTLESGGYHALVATDGTEGIELVRHARPRVVLLDLRLPGISGVEVLEKLPGIDPHIIPIIITGYGTIDSAVHTMKLGAFDFLTKPFDMDQLLAVVDRGLRKYKALGAETAMAKPPTVQAPGPSEPDVLLKGLEALGQYYSLGLRDHTMTGELRALEAEAQYHSKVLGRIREKEKAIADLLADLRMVDEIVERHGFKKRALIQILLDIQSRKNWLPRHTLLWVERRLNIPLAQIYRVAGFYEVFSLEPQGRHIVQVCTGTACHVLGAQKLVEAFSRELGIKTGETTADGLFSLRTVNCPGCCGLAPVVTIGQDVQGRVTHTGIRRLLNQYTPRPSGKEA
jgi:NADH-quinone oxidoreductase subunit E